MWRLVFIVLILVGVLVLKFAGGVLGKELTLFGGFIFCYGWGDWCSKNSWSY